MKILKKRNNKGVCKMVGKQAKFKGKERKRSGGEHKFYTGKDKK